MTTLSRRLHSNWSPLDELFKELDQWAGEGLTGVRANGATGYPLVNISGDEHQLKVLAEVPGVDPAALEVKVQGNVLEISGERKGGELGEGEAWVIQERRFGQFSKKYTLPYEIEEKDVAAVYSAGVLELTLPRHEAAKPKKIDIQIG